MANNRATRQKEKKKSTPSTVHSVVHTVDEVGVVHGQTNQVALVFLDDRLDIVLETWNVVDIRNALIWAVRRDGTVQPGAGSLAAGIEAGNGGSPLGVHRDAAHVVMLRRTHRDGLARRVDADVKAGLGDGGEVGGKAVAECGAGVEKHAAAVADLPPDGAGDGASQFCGYGAHFLQGRLGWFGG